MKKKILITGSAGFLFGNYIRRLIYLHNKSEIYNGIDLNVVSIDLLKSNPKHSMYNNKNHSFYIADIRDKGILNTLFNLEKPDIVIHGASDNSNAKDIISTNIIGTNNIIEKCIEHNSDMIYISETDLENQSQYSQYFATKLCAENFIKSNNKLRYNILRFPEIFGPKQNKQELIPSLIFYLKKDIPCYVENDGLIDRLHVFDACSAITAVLGSKEYKKIYNASNSDLHTDIDIALRIQSIMMKSDLVSKHSDMTSISRSSADSNNLFQLGWRPSYNVNNNLNEQCVQWYLKNNWFLEKN